MFEYENGIRISGTSLWLDATRKVPLSFVSHAHSDHVRPHERIMATPPTISMIKLRNRKVNPISLKFGQIYQHDDIKIELFPAGHILGSSQILIEKDSTRLIYTGDFKIEKNETAEATEIKQSDILIMESTYGASKYIFPKKWVIKEKLAHFVDKCHLRGFVPVILGYRIGKAPEAIKILGDLNFQVSIHGSIEPVIKIYESFGIKFTNYQVYQGEDLRNRVFVIPPHLVKGHIVRKMWNAKTMLLSGWALDESARFRFSSDEVIAMSDHADYKQLLEYVHKVSPEKVFITHGIKSFVKDLRKEGFDAALLKESPQLSLF